MNYAASLDKSNPNSSWESHFKVKLEFDPLSQSFNKLSEPCAVVSTEFSSAGWGDLSLPILKSTGSSGALPDLHKSNSGKTKVLPYSVLQAV